MNQTLEIKNKKKKDGYFKTQFKNLRKNVSIIYFLLPAILLALFFGYLPMIGATWAFREEVSQVNWLYDTLTFTNGWTFDHIVGIFVDETTGPEIFGALGNTLIISCIKILIIFPMTIIFAIFLSEIKNSFISKLVLIILCLPNFLSWPVTINIWVNVFDFINKTLGDWGLITKPILFFDSFFKPLVIFLSIWKGLGWSSIFFYSAIMSIDKEYYEAATIDGANKVQKIWYLTIPGILPVIALQLVMNITYILDAGFDQIYSMFTVTNDDFSQDILGTLIYRYTMSGNQGIPEVVGLSVLNGLLALILMLTGNAVVKKYFGRSLW